MVRGSRRAPGSGAGGDGDLGDLGDLGGLGGLGDLGDLGAGAAWAKKVARAAWAPGRPGRRGGLGAGANRAKKVARGGGGLGTTPSETTPTFRRCRSWISRKFQQNFLSLPVAAAAAPVVRRARPPHSQRPDGGTMTTMILVLAVGYACGCRWPGPGLSLAQAARALLSRALCRCAPRDPEGPSL